MTSRTTRAHHRLSAADRAARGRAARAVLPRSRHAEWDPPATRFLQVKEAEAVQEPFLGESEYPQHGQRVVDFALAYAAQNRNDYATVSAAARKGELAVAS